MRYLIERKHETRDEWYPVYWQGRVKPAAFESLSAAEDMLRATSRFAQDFRLIETEETDAQIDVRRL